MVDHDGCRETATDLVEVERQGELGAEFASDHLGRSGVGVRPQADGGRASVGEEVLVEGQGCRGVDGEG